MKMKFVADDGTLFDYEADCRNYEEKCFKDSISNYYGDIRIFDDDLQELELTEDNIEDCIYLFCNTKEAADFLSVAFSMTCTLPWEYNRLPKTGFFYYDEEVDAWREVETLLKKYEKLLNIYNFLYGEEL